jgi:FixJ family two-component response regulator
VGNVEQPQPTIFVIDDDESVRKALRRLLRAVGLNVETFASAEDILNAMLPPPDCLVLDMRMPGGLSGLELQQRLAGGGPCIPIVFITGYEDQQARQQAMAAGAIAFLQKPFDDQLLLEAVARAAAQSNKITIEGHTDLTFSEDAATKFLGLGWNVTRVASVTRIYNYFKKFDYKTQVRGPASARSIRLFAWPAAIC